MECVRIGPDIYLVTFVSNKVLKFWALEIWTLLYMDRRLLTNAPNIEGT
jgi:hypothetical protein